MMHSVSKKMLVLLLGVSLAHAMQEGHPDKKVVGYKLVYKNQYFSPNKWNPQTFEISIDRNEFTYEDSSGNPVTIRFDNWEALKRSLKKPSPADVAFVRSKIQNLPGAGFTTDHGLVFHNFEKGKLEVGARVKITADLHNDKHMGKMGTIIAKLAKVEGVKQYNVKVDGRGSDNASFVNFGADELKPVKAIYFTYDGGVHNSPWGYITRGNRKGGYMGRRLSVMDELLLASPKEKKQ